MYRMKHIPTGLYYQPLKHLGSHLSTKGKVYHTDVNGVEINRGHETFRIWCSKDNSIYKKTALIINWVKPKYSSNQLYCETNFNDWVKENI